MTGFYAGLATTATKLIKDKGQALTLMRTTPGVYDTATGLAAAPEDAGTLVYGVVLDEPNTELGGNRAGGDRVGGGQVYRGDKKVILEAALAPDTNDTLVIGGLSHVILTVKPLSPGGVTVIYTLTVRLGG